MWLKNPISQVEEESIPLLTIQLDLAELTFIY